MKRIKRIGFGFGSFAHYRIRVLPGTLGVQQSLERRPVEEHAGIDWIAV
jgi:hypothetical protein